MSAQPVLSIAAQLPTTIRNETGRRSANAPDRLSLAGRPCRPDQRAAERVPLGVEEQSHEHIRQGERDQCGAARGADDRAEAAHLIGVGSLGWA
jgi:hypothetical protein